MISAVVAVVALAAVIGIQFFRGNGHRQTPAAQGEPGRVLLVPGYGGGTGALTQLATRLTAAGRAVAVVTPPGDGTGDLRAQADTLENAVRKALDEGAPSVDVVGYSAGGVVTRVWLDRHERATSTRRVVSLGSPLHGTKLAAAGSALAPGSCPTACQQLVPGNDFLDDLDDLPVPVPWLSVWTENDETVQPPDSARLDGAVNVSLQSVCPGVKVAHSQLPTDPLVQALVLLALGTDPIAVPKDCDALRGVA
ncbi:lipase [Virgisporangium aliadipatigenens]|uniref:Lipase n=2 Tax=Virgisporangium aliadipatigenens TaxID=741659 RepID=A0A8J3YF50_9ACTN|nr:lipase [Virgisporangium aliadipatigenens]